MHELKLHAKPGAWRLYAARGADKKFAQFRDEIMQRDRHTCQFCGFQASEYQEVVNLDNNYQNNKQSNLATACVFCAQCLFLESVGVGEYGGGTLVYLPEFSQAELNGLCHVLFCAISNDTGYKSSAQSIYRSLKFRSGAVEDKFGTGTSNPAVFGQLLIDSGTDTQAMAGKLFEQIRLLPSRAKFRVQIERWAASALDELSKEIGS